jgi:hypothetical protein
MAIMAMCAPKAAAMVVANATGTLPPLKPALSARTVSTRPPTPVIVPQIAMTVVDAEIVTVVAVGTVAAIVTVSLAPMLTYHWIRQTQSVQNSTGRVLIAQLLPHQTAHR